MEKKKLYITLGVVMLFIIFFTTIMICDMVKVKRMYEKFELSFTKDDNTLIYIGKKECPYCTLFNPLLEEMSERYNFEYTYIDMDEIGQNYLSKIATKLNITEIATPYLTIINKNGVNDTNKGYMTYEKLFNFLKKNKIISEDKNLQVNYLDYKGYSNLIASDDLNVIVFGTSVDSISPTVELNLNKIIDKYNIKINYLNVSDLTEKEQELFNKSLSYFEENKITSPIMMTIKDNEIKGIFKGYELEEYISFLEDEGVIK